MATGKITRLVRDKGFGFIRSTDGGGSGEFFFHRSGCSSFDGLNEGNTVTFEPDPNAPKGPRAENVELAATS